jgi:hypothetical protein
MIVNGLYFFVNPYLYYVLSRENLTAVIISRKEAQKITRDDDIAGLMPGVLC